MATRTITHPLMGHTVHYPTDITLREGVAADHAGITRLSDVANMYGGWDYVRGRWLEWASRPDTWLLTVAVDDTIGDIVSFVATRLVNRRRHWVGFGGRCHPDYRGRGIYKALNVYRTILGLERFGVPQAALGNGAHLEPFEARRKAGMLTVGHLGNYFFLCHGVQMRQVQDALDELLLRYPLKEFTTFHQITTKDQLKQLFADPAVKADIFPLGHISLTYECFEVNVDVVDDIWDERRFVHVTTLNGHVTSMSFALPFPSHSGTGITIECFGSVNLREALGHVLLNLADLKKYHAMFGGPVYVMFGMPLYKDGKVVKAVKKLFHEDLRLDDNNIGINEYIGMSFKLPNKIKL